jgi:4-hydroxy-2-oxoheptanedioate aldolase
MGCAMNRLTLPDCRRALSWFSLPAGPAIFLGGLVVVLSATAAHGQVPASAPKTDSAETRPQNADRETTWVPSRVNKCIELFERGQPIYYVNGSGGYEEGTALAQTWADYILYDMEHEPYDVTRLRRFMQGLVAGGPTPSGHRTPAVVVTLPVLGLDLDSMKAGSWMVQQVLAAGVHGVHLCHARDPEAIRYFVRSARYPHHKQAIEELGEGLRGFGSQKLAAQIWGVEPEDYFAKADVWPLNPRGELMLGLKIEDRHALKYAEVSCKVPGITFAEWGPRDMGLSYGLLGGDADPPLPKVLEDAGRRVLLACKAADVFFLDNVLPHNVQQRIDEGVMIGAGRLPQSAETGRRYTKRKMPW